MNSTFRSPFAHALLSIVFIAFTSCASAPTTNSSPADAKLETLYERQRVEDTVNRLFIGTDRKDWPALRTLFTERVRFDMSSLTGSPASVLAPADITAQWEKGLTPVGAVHHQSGNFLTEVHGDSADVFCYGTATHYRNPAFRKKVVAFVGSYDVHLILADGKWKIESLRFNKKYVE